MITIIVMSCLTKRTTDQSIGQRWNDQPTGDPPVSLSNLQVTSITMALILASASSSSSTWYVCTCANPKVREEGQMLCSISPCSRAD
jgi:hypothetical protein